MTILAAQQPFPIFTDSDGKPINNGFLYIGAVSQNPETNPVSVYWDAAGTQPAPQPLTINGGLIYRTGSPANVFVDGAYSLTLKDKKGRLIYYTADATVASNASALQQQISLLYSSVQSSIAGLRTRLKTGPAFCNVTGYYAAGDGGGGLYYYDSTDTTSADNGGTIIVAADGGRWKLSWAGSTMSVRVFGAYGDGVHDDTAAIQATINYVAALGLVGGAADLGTGQYKVSSTIRTYGAGATGQCALIGDAPYAARLFPSGDFTVLNDISSYSETGGFSIEWPVTARASIPVTRIGVEFAGGNWQNSYTTKKKITVQYAYRGFVLNDWTGQPLGTIYLIKLFALTAFRCADWGIYINSKVGSTTTILEQCYVRGDDSTGTPAAKGIYVNNVDDVLMQDCAIDQCVDNWVQVQNSSNYTAVNLALEANKMLSPSAVAVNINSTSAAIYGVKTISCTYSTGGNARVISIGANTFNLVIQGYSEIGATIAGGTTRYKAVTNASGSHLHILDRSILPSEVLDNGWFANVVYEGVRRSSSNLAPNYGTWVRGDYVKSGVPAVGAPKGWYCTVAGSPGTWVSEGNL